MNNNRKEIEELSNVVIGAAIKIHKATGPGLLEKAYERMLIYELKEMGLHVENQVKIPLKYEDLYIPDCYRLDLLVNKELIIEIKSVRALEDVHMKQVLTYLKLLNKKLGLIMNFNEPTLKSGIKGVIDYLFYFSRRHEGHKDYFP